MISSLLAAATLYVASKTNETHLTESYAFLMTIMLLIFSVLYGLRNWLNEPVVTLEPIVKTEYGQLIGNPRFDPYVGIIGTVSLANGETAEIVVNPEWWRFLPETVTNMSQKETVVSTSRIGSCATEPSNMCCIQLESGVIVGIATRVAFGSSTSLLTCWHVLAAHAHEDLYLCKNGLRIKMEKTWEMNLCCKDDDLDIVLLQVPIEIWSKLGVKKSTIGVARGKSAVTAFGARTSSQYMSSVGTGVVEPRKLNMIHTCSTQVGWSGTPIFHNGKIVALHRGFNKRGVSNNATILWPLIYSCETEYEDAVYRRGEEEELDFRAEPFDEYEVHGMGTLKVGTGEYIVQAFKSHAEELRESESALRSGGRKTWHDYAEEDEFEYYDSMETTFDLESHLNCQQAEEKSLPPLSSSATTNGVNLESSNQPECHSLQWDSRVLNLEKLVEHLTTLSSLCLEASSLNSKNIVGLTEALKLKELPSCTKPQDLRKQAPQTTYRQQWKPLSKNTPGQNAGESLLPNGTTLQSKAKSRRSAKRRSTQKPRQESH